MTRSIIFKKQDKGEADELVVFFSRDLGWLTGVAKNSKKSRVRFGGHLEKLSVADLTLRIRRKDDLVWVDEAQTVAGHPDLRNHILKVAQACYFLELASVLMPEGHPDDKLFDFLVEFLDVLDARSPSRVQLLIDELRILGFLGYAPGFDLCPVCAQPLHASEEGMFWNQGGGVCHLGCVTVTRDKAIHVSPGSLAVVRRGLQLDRDAVNRLRINQQGLSEIRASLSGFVRYLRGQEIKSLLFLEKLLDTSHTMRP